MNFGNRGGKGRRRTEITPGGSEMFNYAEGRPQIGIAPDESARYQEMREHVYEEFFGPCETVNHEFDVQAPHVDVYIHPPGHSGRDFYTLITGGMSDLPMRVPRGVDTNRAELVLYVQEPTEDHIAILRFPAHFVHDHRTWFGEGHTFPNGQPPEPFFEGSELDTLLMIDSILRPDAGLPEHLQIGKSPVSLLWVVPITSAECDLKLREGIGALLDLFDRVQHPFILEETRRSYV